MAALLHVLPRTPHRQLKDEVRLQRALDLLLRTRRPIKQVAHNVHADLRAAYNRWEKLQMRSVMKVIKGTDPWTEHYALCWLKCLMRMTLIPN